MILLRWMERPMGKAWCFTGAEMLMAAAVAVSAGTAAYQAANQPEAPAILPPPEAEAAPPNPDDADTKARLAAAQARERRRKSGSLLTNPTSGQPLAQAPVSVKSLLGQ